MNELITLYARILDDTQWNQWREVADQLQPDTSEKFVCCHGRGHTMRVVEYAEDFLDQVRAGARELWRAKIACLLHDIGNTVSRHGHANESVKLAGPYLESLGVDEESRVVILHAIGEHNEGRNMRSLVDAAVVLGDKLDVNYERMKYSYPAEWVNELFSSIKKVGYVVDEDVVRLKYTTEPDFDVELTKKWYKCISVPEKVAHFIGRDFEFWVNDEKQDLSKLAPVPGEEQSN
jgi:exopolyphosphatase/pppGpp-phosphohydrolase